MIPIKNISKNELNPDETTEWYYKQYKKYLSLYEKLQDKYKKNCIPEGCKVISNKKYNKLSDIYTFNKKLYFSLPLNMRTENWKKIVLDLVDEGIHNKKMIDSFENDNKDILY
jgi:hypothetical protein